MKTNLTLAMNISSFMAICIVAVVLSGSVSYGSSNSNSVTISESLEKAKKDGKAVFLVVTGTGDSLHEKAIDTAKKANKLYKNSVLLEMDRNDTTNNALVALYGLSNAPLPLTLVFSPHGILAWGYLYAQATAEILVKTIPSPKKDDILMALNDKKSVFVVVTKKSFIDQWDIIARCDSAIAKMDKKAEMVKVYYDDEEEAPLLELLKVDLTSSKTATVIVNVKGQVNATYYELKNAADLVTAATKVVSSCCPGSSKTCTPKK